MFFMFLHASSDQSNLSRRWLCTMNLIAKKNELEQLYAKYWKIQHQLEQEDTCVSDKDVEGKIRDVIADSSLNDRFVRTPGMRKRN